MSISLTMKELANAAGYTYRRLYDINNALPQDKKLFVKGEGNKYDLAIFVQRWVDYNVRQESSFDETEDLDTVKARHEVIKAEKTQLEVDRMRGQLIDVQDVRRIWGSVISTAVQNLLHVGSKCAPMLVMMDNQEIIIDIISTAIRDALNDTANTPLPTYAAEDSAADKDDSEEDGDEEV